MWGEGSGRRQWVHCHGPGVPHQVLHLSRMRERTSWKALLRNGRKTLLRGRLPGGLTFAYACDWIVAFSLIQESSFNLRQHLRRTCKCSSAKCRCSVERQCCLVNQVITARPVLSCSSLKKKRLILCHMVKIFYLVFICQTLLTSSWNSILSVLCPQS